MAKTLEQLLSLSSIIANETKAGANTALRVGGLFSDIIYYLRDLDYADKDDIPSLDGYATEQWVLGKGYATTTDLDARIDALVNGAPQAYDTLKEIADVLANNINSIDDILTALGTKVSKDDFNTAIANVNSSISALNTELSGKIDLKLDAVTFNELFEKVQLEDGTWAIKAKLGLFSDGFISAKGSNVGGTTSEGGAVALYQLNDVLADGTGVSGSQHGAVFVYDATIGKWKGVAQSEIVPNLTGYATESWVLSQGFLTQHQDLSDYAKLTDIPTIPTTDINKGVTAYGWGDHSKVGYLIASSLDGYVNDIATEGNGNAITSVSKNGKKIIFTKGATYLTGITSKLVTDALGYTPYDAANFTKAKIKSTLGISDWALASSKPSYTTKEVAEDTNLYFTNARAVAALKSITDGLSASITSNTTKITNLTTKVDDHISVFNSMFKLVELSDGTMSIQALHGLWSDGFISAKGANSSGGSSSGGGLIQSLFRYADLGKTFADTNNDTFNAYTINKINTDLGSRISVLEGKATNVSFTQSLTSGTQIGTITIDGASKNIYAPTIPTNLSQFTDDVVSGKYLHLSGGTIQNSVGVPLVINNSTVGGASCINFRVANVDKAQIGYENALQGTILYNYNSGKFIGVKDDGTPVYSGNTLWHSGNFTPSDYLPLSGGTISGTTMRPLTIKTSSSSIETQFITDNNVRIFLGWNNQDGVFLQEGVSSKYIGIKTDGTPYYYNGARNTLIHSGNYTDYTYSKSTIDTKLSGYLPLSGGTIDSGSNRDALTINSNNGSGPLFGLNVSNVKRVVLGVSPHASYGAFWSYLDGNVAILLGTNGKAYIANEVDMFSDKKEIIHSGNIGSQSVLSAEKLVDASGAELVSSSDRTLYVGGGTYTSRDTHILGSGVRLRYGASAAVGLLLNSSGNVLIGTTTDSGYKLDVDGNAYFNSYVAIANNNGLYFKDNSGTIRSQVYIDQYNNTSIGYGAAQTGGNTSVYGTDIVFHSSADRAERVRISSNGNVGIGTTNPQYKLDVNGNVRVQKYSYSLGFRTKGEYGLWYGAGFSGSLTDNDIVLYGEKVVLWGNNVGIGTLNPQAKLDVNGNAMIVASSKKGAMASAISSSAIVEIGGIEKGNDALYIGQLDNSTIWLQAAYGGSSSIASSRYTYPLVLNPIGGNVGIGTTSPKYKLDVVGDVRFSSEAGQNSYLYLNRNGSDGGILFQDKGVNKWQVVNTNNGLDFYDYTRGVYALTIGIDGVLNYVGTIHSTIGIYSDGYVSAKGQNTSSDMRLKNVLGEVVLSVKDIANAPSMRFSWKNGGGVDVGSSAQYWQGLLPDAVKERDGMLEMQYANIALLSAIALAKNVETHEERIVRLEKENKELRNEISMIKGGIYE